MSDSESKITLDESVVQFRKLYPYIELSDEQIRQRGYDRVVKNKMIPHERSRPTSRDIKFNGIEYIQIVAPSIANKPTVRKTKSSVVVNEVVDRVDSVSHTKPRRRLKVYLQQLENTLIFRVDEQNFTIYDVEPTDRVQICNTPDMDEECLYLRSTDIKYNFGMSQMIFDTADKAITHRDSVLDWLHEFVDANTVSEVEAEPMIGDAVEYGSGESEFASFIVDILDDKKIRNNYLIIDQTTPQIYPLFTVVAFARDNFRLIGKPFDSTDSYDAITGIFDAEF